MWISIHCSQTVRIRDGMEITVGHGHLSIPIRRFSVRGNLAPLANGALQYPPVGSPVLDLPDLC